MIKTLHSHQEKARLIGRQIHEGSRDDRIVAAYVSPGGGKTLMASLFAHELLKRDVTRVLVICPRVTLQTQMRDGFHVPEMGLMGGLRVGYASSRLLFREERAGVVTTYQDVVANPGRWLAFVQSEPTLVVLDEAHHMPEGPVQDSDDIEGMQWRTSVAPLVEAAKRVLLMTGTIKRAKGRIAFLQYNEDRTPVFAINCTRRDALDAHAVLNVSVQLADGIAKYWHRFTGSHEHTLSVVGGVEESRALRALLDSEEYRTAMLRLALDDLGRYRSTRNPRARMIVICSTQASARSVDEWIREDGSYRSILAISSETTAHARIARFRDRGEGEVLVTVGMAYEGLDVPDCTHLVCLTNYRARSWLEQALSRVTRMDRNCTLSWEEQCAYLYVPNDPSMVQFLAEWIDEQDCKYADPPIPRDGVGDVPRIRAALVTESGELTDVRYADTYGIYSEIDQRRIVAAKRRFKFLAGTAAMHLLDLGRQCWPKDDDVPTDDSSEGAAE